MATALQHLDMKQVNRDLAGKSAEDIVRFAHEHFAAGLVMSSSFGAQAAVMLHLVTRIVPDVPVVWVDTGYLFPETYQFAHALADRLKLNLKVYQSAMSPAHMEAVEGKLWEGDLDDLNRYDRLRKVEPMNRALDDLNASAWLSGVRRQQTAHRAGMDYVTYRNNLYKVHPILDWSTKDIHEYLTTHDLPYHPLYFQGYASIGDWHSTRSIMDGEDERAGRFRGMKQECGLHLPESPDEGQSRDSSGL